MQIKKRTLITLIIFSILILFSFVIILTNVTCLSKIHTENRYRKENGLSLLYGLASTFHAWGNDIDKSDRYFISKKCFDRFGASYHVNADIDLRKASKNNTFLDRRTLKVNNKTIYINQCIILRDVKVLYLAYNTFFSDTKNSYKISLYHSGNIIADTPSFTDITTSWMLKNYENYFWGIDFDQYDTITLHIEVYSAEGDFLYDCDHLLF